MTDLIALMSKLVDGQGNILIPGVDEMVEGPTESERLVLFPWLSRQKRELKHFDSA